MNAGSGTSLRCVIALVVGSLALGGVRASDAQAKRVKVDPVAAARGKKVWKSKQCYGCHELGRSQSTGPDLIGVTDRRSAAWIRKWLKNPVEMAKEDSTAMALKKQFNSQMPIVKLSSEEVEALINYLAQQTQEHRAGK